MRKQFIVAFIVLLSVAAGVTAQNAAYGTLTRITITPTQAGLGNVTNDAQTKAAIMPNTAPSAGQIPVGNAGGAAYAPVSMSQDCSITSAGVVTCTKTNNVSLTALATTAPGTGVATFLASPSGANLASALTSAIPFTSIAPVAVPTPGTSITLAAPGGIAVCTGTCTVTIPVPAAGQVYCVVDDVGVTSAITVNNPGSSVQFGKTDGSAYGTATTGTAVSTAGTNSKICFFGRDSTHFVTQSSAGTWTMN